MLLFGCRTAERPVRRQEWQLGCRCARTLRSSAAERQDTSSCISRESKSQPTVRTSSEVFEKFESESLSDSLCAIVTCGFNCCAVPLRSRQFRAFAAASFFFSLLFLTPLPLARDPNRVPQQKLHLW